MFWATNLNVTSEEKNDQRVYNERFSELARGKMQEKPRTMLVTLLRETFSNRASEIKSVERKLEALASGPEFLTDVLELVFAGDSEPDLRVAAAVCFKNFIDNHWTDLNLSDAIRNQIKEKILGCYLVCDKVISSQFLRVILIIASYDFPEKWPQLIIDVSNTLTNINSDNCIDNKRSCALLKLTSSLFKKYSIEDYSDTLWQEIKFVLNIFSSVMFCMFGRLISVFPPVSEDYNVVFSEIKYLIKIFYYLTSQELPDLILESKESWFSSFIKILKLDIRSSCNFEAIKVLNECKILILKVSGLFLRKYTADFDTLVPAIMEAVWEICVCVSSDEIDEELSAHALGFIRIIFSTGSIRSLFDKDENIMNLCGNIIIPNLMPTEKDIDLLEEEPAVFVRKEIYGEIGSRQTQSSDLASSLSFAYESRAVPIFMSYISQLLQQSQDNTHGWKYRDVAVRLVIATSNKFGSIKFGSSEISPLIDVNKTYKEIILPILSMKIPYPLLIASALKYLIVFRKSMDNSLIDSSLNLVLSFSSHKLAIQYLVQIFFEGIFLPPDDSHYNTRFQIIIPLIPTIYSSLLQSISFNKVSLCDITFNFLNSLMLRTHSLSKDHLILIIQTLVSLTRDFRSPTLDPNYSFFVSESLCLALRMLNVHDNQNFIKLSKEILDSMIKITISQSETTIDNYIFIISVIVSYNNSIEYDYLKEYFNKLMEEDFWEGDTNHIAAVALLNASFMKAFSYQILNQNLCFFSIRIFYKYSSNIRYDSVVFYIINSLVLYLPWKTYGFKFPSEVFECIFKRLTTIKKPKFLSGFADFIYHYISILGADDFVNQVESIQPSIILKIIRSVLIGEISQPITLLRKKNLMIACCDLILVLATRRSYSYIEIKENLLKLYSSNPPSIPVKKIEYEKYYKDLGNTDPDLVPTFDSLNDSTIRLIKYAMLPTDHHSGVTNVKAYIKEKYFEIKKYLDYETGQYIQYQIDNT